MKGKKGKEEKKRRQKKKVGKKEFQCGNRTHDLLICSRHYHLATASGFDWKLEIARTYLLYIANFDFDDLTVAALAPSIIDNKLFKHMFCACWLIIYYRNLFPCC